MRVLCDDGSPILLECHAFVGNAMIAFDGNAVRVLCDDGSPISLECHAFGGNAVRIVRRNEHI